MIKTDLQQENYIDSLARIEVASANSDLLEWHSLFSNIIEPRKKDLPSARELYDSLTNEEVEIRQAVHGWEQGAWNNYESLMGNSLRPLGRSIEPKRWAQKEIVNIGLLLQEGRNLLISPIKLKTECANKMSELYNKLLMGEWDSFIVTGEINSFHKAASDYFKDNDFNIDDLTKIEFSVFMAQPREEQFINASYFIAQEIQALIWYREFLTEVMHNGITYFLDNEPKKSDEQIGKAPKNHIYTKSLKRTDSGFEAIKASFDDFIDTKGRFPKWGELMLYMAKKPPSGFIVEASYKGNLVSKLSIEGVSNEIDRDAFRHRYSRYFKESDIKVDINKDIK